MECFAHSDKSAVGLCKSCYKAVCRECAIEVESALACSEVCADGVRESNDLNERAKKLYGIGARRSRIPATGVLLWGFISCITWACFLYPYILKGNFISGRMIAALIFTVIWAITYYSAKRTGLQC